MRTTVTLDPDAEQLVRDRMRTRGVSFKQALNDAIRDGAHGRVDYVFEMPVRSMGAPAVDLTKALRLAGDLEDATVLAAMRVDG
jgi:hypothetical protein